ncbi:MAG TPA: phage tail tape measure protein, partial [Gemmatimonadales bacterium]|nr:phage tail tape measure protein [Gemmatimonadales bacterium]
INAAQAADVLTATVREGKGEADRFAPVIGNVVALAAQLGVSFDQVGAALAVQTRLGTDAETTAIQLQRVFSTLLKVTPKSAEAFESVGLNADKLREQLGEKNGLIKVLTQVKAAFEGNSPALAQAFGDVRALRGILNLVGKQTKSTQEVFDKLANSAGSAKQAFDAVDKDTAQQFRKLKASAEVLGISVGAIFAPLAAGAATALAKVTQDFTKFTDKIGKTQGFQAKLDVVVTGLEGLGARLSRFLLAEFKKINFGEAGRVFGQKAIELFHNLSRAFDSVDWGNLGKVIVRDIGNFLAGIDWVGVVKGMVTLFIKANIAGAKLLVGAGLEFMRQFDLGVRKGAKIAIAYVELFALQLVKKLAGATSFLGRFDPLKGVKEKAAVRIKEIQLEIDSLRGKTVEVNIQTKVTSADIARRKGGGKGDQFAELNKQTQESAQAEIEFVSAAEKARIKAAARAAQAAAKAEKAKKEAIKAFAKLQDAFNLREQRAGLTKSLQDDISAQQSIQADIRREIAIEGKTAALMLQLFESQQKVREFEKQIQENRKAQRQKNQFQALGLTTTGEDRLAGNKTLAKRANNLREMIKGTVLDTPKTNSQLTRISKILAGKFGKVGREVRAAIVQMLDDIKSALDDGGKDLKGPLTATSGLNTKKIAEGLGLSEFQINELRGRLSGFNTGGRAITQPVGSPGTSGGFGGAQQPVIVENHITLEVDGQKMANLVERHRQKRNRRNPSQKRGPHRN